MAAALYTLRLPTAVCRFYFSWRRCGMQQTLEGSEFLQQRNFDALQHQTLHEALMLDRNRWYQSRQSCLP